MESLESVDWCSVMKDRAPDILDFIATVAAPGLKKNVDGQVPPVCMVYAMMMNQRWQELSLVEKIARILGVGHSSKMVNLSMQGQLQNIQTERAKEVVAKCTPHPLRKKKKKKQK